MQGKGFFKVSLLLCLFMIASISLITLQQNSAQHASIFSAKNLSEKNTAGSCIYQENDLVLKTVQASNLELLTIYDEISGRAARAYAFDLQQHDVIQANFSDTQIGLEFKVIDPLGNELRHAYVDNNTIIFVAWTTGRYVIQISNPEPTTAIFNATVYKLTATEITAGTSTKTLSPGEYVGYYVDFNRTSQASTSLTGTVGTDYNLYIFDANGNLHAYSERTEYPDEVDFAVLHPEPYYIVVYARRNKDDGSMALNLVITDPYLQEIGATVAEQITNPTSTIIYEITTTNDAIYKINLTTPDSYIDRTIFNDDLEGDVSKWIPQGGWTLIDTDYHSATHSWSISGAKESGLITPVIDLTIAKGGVAKLVFWSKRDTTYYQYSGYEYYVDVSSDAGVTWTEIKEVYPHDTSIWEKIEVDISDFFGERIQIRFRYVGTEDTDFWKVDDISVVVAYGATTMKIYSEDLALKYTVDNAYSQHSYTTYIKYFVSPENKKYYLVISATNATEYTLITTMYASVELKTEGFSYISDEETKWFALKMLEGTTTYVKKEYYTQVEIYDEDMNLLVTAGYKPMDIRNITVHKDTYVVFKLYSDNDYIWVFTPSKVPIATPGTYMQNITITGADYGFYVNASVGEQVKLTLSGPSDTNANIYVYYQGKVLAESKFSSYPDRVVFAVVSSGLYFVKVRSISGSGTFTVTYTKEAVPILLEPATEISEELEGYTGIMGYKFSSDGYHFAHFTLNSTTIFDLVIEIYDPFGTKILSHESSAEYPTELSFNTIIEGDYIILVLSTTGYLANYNLTFQGVSNDEITPGSYSGSIGSSSSTSLKAYAFHAPLGAIISVKVSEDSGTVIWVEGLDQKGLVRAYNRTNIYAGTRILYYASPMNGTAFAGLINKGLSGSYNITIRVQLTVLLFSENYDFRKPIISDISYTPEVPQPADEVVVKAAVASLLNITVSVQLNWTTDDVTWHIQDMTQIRGGAYYKASIPPQPLFTQVKFKIIAEEEDGDKQETDLYSYIVTETEPPTVQITGPEDDSYMATTLVNVTWTASDEVSGLDKIEIYVDGSLNVTLQPDQTAYQLNLAEGIHEIKVKAYDKAGNTAEDVITVTVDLTAPTIEITEPENQSTLSSENVLISWSASDNFGIREFQIHVNGSLIATLGGDTSSTTLSLDTGSYTIRVTAIDYAGHSASDEITITIVPPTPSEQPISGEEEGETGGGLLGGIYVVGMVSVAVVATGVVAMLVLKKRPK